MRSRTRPLTPTRWAQLERYLLTDRDLAPSTTSKTLRHLRRLEKHHQFNLERPNRDTYRFFLANQKMAQKDGPGIRHYARALKHLLAWHNTSWPNFHLPRVGRAETRLLPDTTVQQLVYYTNPREWTLDIETARFCFQLGFYTGIRWPSEAHDLTISDYAENTHELRVFMDKTERHRTIHLEPWLSTMLQQYIRGPRQQLLTTYKTRRENALLINPKTGRAFTREGLRMYTWRHGRKIAPTFRCRTMRTWNAIHLLLETRDVYFVKDRLGHEKLSSTEHYLVLSQAEARRREYAPKLAPLDPPETSKRMATG